jgi:putative lipoic acid-binding regulatory protein
MMNNAYRDFQEGQVIPDVTISRRSDNGHYVAEAMGVKVTHYDQTEAVNRLTSKIQEGLASGTLNPQG